VIPKSMPPTAAQRRASKASNVTSEDVNELILKAMTSFKTEVSNCTNDLLQRQMAEFRSEMKQEFRAYMEEAKQHQPAGTPDVSTKAGSARGSRGIFPTVEAIKKESGRFRALLDQ
jgi:hypothetical protein